MYLHSFISWKALLWQYLHMDNTFITAIRCSPAQALLWPSCKMSSGITKHNDHRTAAATPALEASTIQGILLEVTLSRSGLSCAWCHSRRKTVGSQQHNVSHWCLGPDQESMASTLLWCSVLCIKYIRSRAQHTGCLNFDSWFCRTFCVRN